MSVSADYALSPKSASVIARQERQAKGRNRHLPWQTEALNDVFARTDHPTLQERTELGQRLGMETKVVNSWFQNKRASLKKRAERLASGDFFKTPSAESVCSMDHRDQTPSISAPPRPHPSSLPPPKTNHGSMPPRLGYTQLPSFADLIQQPHDYAALADDSDHDSEGGRSVALPSIQDNPILRAAILRPVHLQKRPSGYAHSASDVYSASRSTTPISRTGPLDSVSVRALTPDDDDRHSVRSLDTPRYAFSNGHLPPLGSYSRAPASVPSMRYSHIRHATGSLDADISGADSDAPSDFHLMPRRRESDEHSVASVASYASAPVITAAAASPLGSVAVGAGVGVDIKGRRRLAAYQIEELRRVYDMDTHPSREERERISAETGLRMQSITTWFQNQRSMAKRRRVDAAREGRPGAPSTASDPALPTLLRTASSLVSAPSSGGGGGRPRRSRPEPFQLEALRQLYEQTTTPSLEQRAALALELGMEVAKVTNWFRNLRQTAKKRARGSRGGLGAAGGEDEDESDAESVGDASVHGGASKTAHGDDDPMDVDSGFVSSDEEDDHEIVTPSPPASSYPLPLHAPKPPQPSPPQQPDVSMEDAVLLLGLRGASH